MTKKKRKTVADYQREVGELKAQLSSMYHFAAADLRKAGTQHMGGSAVILRLHALGGHEIITPIAICDGLSDDTIAALRRDIVRSYERSTELKPKGD